MVVTSRRRGWTQETRCYSHLEQTRPTRRVVTLIWSRQAFEVLLIGSGDGSSRISASACERWQKGVGHTTTGLSHSLRALVVLGCGWGAADRPLGSAVRMCERSKKTDPLPPLAAPDRGWSLLYTFRSTPPVLQAATAHRFLFLHVGRRAERPCQGDLKATDFQMT